MRYAALIPCGPSRLDAQRLADLLEALAFHDPVDCAIAIVLNDANPFMEEHLGAFPRCRVMENPRKGRGWGVGGGLAAGQIWALEEIARDYPQLGCVVKIDTDALPLRPLGGVLERVFADEGVGIAGSRIGPEPLPAYKVTPALLYFANKIRKLRAPLSLWRMPGWHVRQALWGRHRWVASLCGRAEAHGYVAGELIEGGAYAMRLAMAHRLVEAGITARWRDFLDVPVSEDLVMTMLAYVAGLRAADVPYFCIEPDTLRHAPADLIGDAGVGIVHSVKRFRGATEEELRRAFREARLRPA
jgi:hypothetical protein